MPPRRLFTVILSLTFFLAACAISTPEPTLIPPSPLPPTATTIPSPTARPVYSAPPKDTPAATAIVTFPDVRQFQWTEVAAGINRPTVLTHAGDARLFIVEQAGRIRILQDSQLLEPPFLNIAKIQRKRLFLRQLH
jgi:ABC-type uncharacterized transport system auxiliary subunit